MKNYIAQKIGMFAAPFSERLTKKLFRKRIPQPQNPHIYFNLEVKCEKFIKL